MYGVGTAAWEGAQFYVGGQIAGFEAFSSTGANIAAIINGEKIFVTVYDLKPYIILSTTDENLEMDNLLSEKK